MPISPKTGKKRKTKTRYRKPAGRIMGLLDGTLSMDDLDYEELQRGQLRAADGTFRGRPSDAVPRKLHDLLREELMRRWQQKVEAELQESLEALKEIRNNKRLPADARYKSAVYLIERAAGKVPEKNEVKLNVQKWEEDIEGLLYEAGEKKDE